MARSGAGLKLREWLFRRTQLSTCTVESINHHFIDSEIGSERVAFRAIEDDAMCVRSFLLVFRSGTFVLFHFGRPFRVFRQNEVETRSRCRRCSLPPATFVSCYRH